MMQFAHRHIETAGKIISRYDGAAPLQHHLKQFFAADKKYGSRDRKAIAHACYCYYRLGRSLNHLPVDEKIKAGLFLCNNEPGIWSSAFEEAWIHHWSRDIVERMAFAEKQIGFVLKEVFPLHTHVSESIDVELFLASHLIQPDLHLRIRPGKKTMAYHALDGSGLPYKSCGEYCIALPNSSRLDTVLEPDKEIVVQDLSSQRISEFLSLVHPSSPSIKVWDCCAASGGKSILAADFFPGVELTVSDVRPSIIQNLKKRFASAGIRNYHSFIADVADPGFRHNAQYDLVICDVPCSGSGTWSRTPEQLSFFEEKKIGHYTNLQKKITQNVIQAVVKDGYLLYITCSVFKEENDEIVEYIQMNTPLQLLKTEVLKGYDKKADTMFAALFKNGS